MITPITIRGVTLYVLLKIDPTERWFQFQFPVSWYVYDTPPTYYFDRNLKFNVACTRWGAMRQAKRACRVLCLNLPKENPVTRRTRLILTFIGAVLVSASVFFLAVPNASATYPTTSTTSTTHKPPTTTTTEHQTTTTTAPATTTTAPPATTTIAPKPPVATPPVPVPTPPKVTG